MQDNPFRRGTIEHWLVGRPNQKFTKTLLATATLLTGIPFFSLSGTLVLMSIIAVHEYGHIVAMRMCGIPCAGFYFIPMAGGIAIPLRGWRSLGHSVAVSLGGAVFGAIATVALMLAYLCYPDVILGGVIWLSALGNLVGLIPISRMDGGRCVQAVFFSLRGRDTANCEPGSGWEDLLAVLSYLSLVTALAVIVMDPTLRGDAFVAWCHWRFLVYGG
jgi:hypothetical protein